MGQLPHEYREKLNTPIERGILMKRLIVCIILIALLHVAAAPTYARPLSQTTGTTTLVSVSTGGGPATGISNYPDISADGRYVAFTSSSPVLVAGDTNGQGDCFVRDMQTGQTSRVSVSSAGAQGNGSSGSAVISADGRFVAFSSSATNLVTGDTNTQLDIFVHDRDTGQITRVSVSSAGAQSNGASNRPAISTDGRYITYYSTATNLVGDDTNGVVDVFVYDQQTGQTKRISVSSSGAQGNAGSTSADISGDGRYVVFASRATNLAPEGTNGYWAFYLHDQQTAQTTYIAQSNTPSSDAVARFASFSRDGNYIAFEANTFFSNEDTNFSDDIYRYNRLTGEIALVSIASNGETSFLGISLMPSISADGRYIAFYSDSSDLISGDTNGTADIFLRDMQTGTTTRVSVTSAGVEANGASEYPAISADGHYVAFSSLAANLAPTDPDSWRQIYLHEIVQAPPPGGFSISGTVNVLGGKPLPGARISDGQGHTVISGMDGSFIITGLENGNYLVTVEKRGYTFPSSSLPVTVSGSDVSGAAFTADLPQWTLIYVLNGDNDLDADYQKTFNHIEAGTGNPGVNVVVLWDRLGTGDSAYYWMKPDANLATMATYTVGEDIWPQNELNMGDPTVLSSFTAWAMDSFPASQYTLVLDDHGDGLGGALLDETSSGDLLTLKEIQTAILQPISTRQKLNVLVTNTCLMGMVEDGYQFRDLADYYVASEDRQKTFTTGYTNTLNVITQSDVPLAVAQAFANGYANEIITLGQSYTMSVADLSKVGALKTAIESLAGELDAEVANYSIQLWAIRNFSVKSFKGDYIDLYDFARLVKASFIDPEIQSAADGVMAAVQDNYIVHNSSSFDTAHGVSIFFPGMKSSYYDDRYDFSVGTDWAVTEGPDIQASIRAAAIPQVWGNMLAVVLFQVDPNGADNPTPPLPLSKLEEYQVFLPLLKR